MGFFHLLWSLLVGFIVGLVARAVMPGVDKMGFLLTMVLGILGSVVGGFIGSLFSKPKEGSSFHTAGFIMSVIGALILLFVWNRLR
jgi:uncharacterized membrane protein YeaQ/YmgE (transglycosylase-associated protein family)